MWQRHWYIFVHFLITVLKRFFLSQDQFCNRNFKVAPGWGGKLGYFTLFFLTFTYLHLLGFLTKHVELKLMGQMLQRLWYIFVRFLRTVLKRFFLSQDQFCKTFFKVSLGQGAKLGYFTLFFLFFTYLHLLWLPSKHVEVRLMGQTRQRHWYIFVRFLRDFSSVWTYFVKLF